MFTLMLCIVAVSYDVAEGKSNKFVYQNNNNFENPLKWSNGNRPCAGDRVLFDANTVVSVFVQTNETISEITLPMNGELIFDDNVFWGSSDELSSCKESRDVSFVSGVNDWYNGKDWDVNDGGQVSKLDLLDVEKVPCEFDDVEFLPQNSWSVFIPLDVVSSSLTIWEKSYTTESFQEYRDSGSGRFQFQGSGRVAANRANCVDVTGCVCRTASNIEEIETTICNHVECLEKCEKPFYPPGQCCSTCGALLTMQYTTSYSEEAMREQLNQLKAKTQYASVHFALSKILSDLTTKTLHSSDSQQLSIGGSYIQVLLRDEETGENYGSLAKSFSKELLQILDTDGESLGVSNVTSVSSGNGINPEKSMGGGAIAGIVIGVICGLSLLLVAAFFVHKTWRSPGGFRNFKSKDESASLDNPLYDLSYDGDESIDQPRKEKTSASITGIPDTTGVLTSDFGVSFGNPLYQEEDV